MADNVFTLGVDLETKDAQSGLKDLQKELQKTTDAAKTVGKGFGAGLKDIDAGIKDLAGNLQGLTGSGGVGGITDSVAGLTRGLGLAGGAFVGIAAVAGAATFALIANASAMAAAADDAAELADNLGITTTQLASLQLLASETGTSAQSLVSTFDKLGKSLNEVSDGNINTENSFRRLGIAQSDLAGKSREEIAGIVIKNYETLGRTVQATAAAQDILGKSFRENISAIKASADGMKEYEDRVTSAGAVASQALVDAGQAQETAINNLKLKITGLQNAFAELFSGTITDSAKWADGVISSVTRVAKAFNTPNVSLSERVKIEREEFAKVPVSERIFSIEKNKEINAIINARVMALNQERQAVKDLADNESKRELQRESQRGKVGGVKPLADKVKPKETEQARLTEEQKNVIALSNAMRSSFADLDKQLATSTMANGSVEKSVTELAHKLFDAGKGVISYSEALKIASTQQEKFAQVLVNTNTAKFNEDVKKLNEDYGLQLKLLTATTEQEREQIKLRAQLSKTFETQKGGATPAQAKELEKALAGANEQFAKLQQQKINNSVKDSMRDLAEQGADLAYEVENYWKATEYGVKDSTVALRQLYRQLDPEGRGKNLSEQQKKDLEGQVAFIEKQKLLLEQNRQIEDSFKDIGSAVSDWAMGSEGAIRRVKLELVKLIALQAMKAYGGTGNSIVDTFLGGVIGGLSGARAEGGPIDANKSYLVGEKGPEVVKFKQSGYVIPNHQIAAASPRTTMITVSPNLIIQGGVTGQSELDRAFEQFAGAMAAETQKLIVRQAGGNGILRGR